MLIDPHGKVKQRVTISPIQIACILGLEHILTPHQLILTCPRCASDGKPVLETDNDPNAPIWKIDCGCMERRIQRAVWKAMDADGELIANADQILQSIRLSVRCGERRCVRHAMDIYRLNGQVVAACRCAKTTFRPSQTTVH